MRSGASSTGLCLIGILLASTSASAVAQTSEQQSAVDEQANSDDSVDIIVTARKRDETSLAVPVILTAVSADQLNKRGINSIDGLTKLVPTLIAGEGGGAQQGIVAIRGFSGSESNPIADQAVSFNIDGVQVARASVRRMATMDLAQIEVLKGPQALFFGKNSPAGVISIKSAEPTRDFAAKISASYEVIGEEVATEGFVSGPLTPTLGARVAFYASDLHGWGHNLIDPGNGYAPSNRNMGASKEGAIRGTLKFDPSDRFTATLRASYSKLRTNGPFDTTQVIDCPLGVTQLGDPIACIADDENYLGSSGPVAGTIQPRIGDGDPYLKQSQRLYSLNMGYEISDDLHIASITGLYDLKTRMVDSTAVTGNPSFIRPAAIDLDFKELSQELRLHSSYPGFLNFVMGIHLSDSEAYSFTQTFAGAVTPVTGSTWDVVQKGTAWSALGQIILTPIDTLEISAGGRYSYEKKRLSRAKGGPLFVDQPPIQSSETWNDFSPEVTVAFRPNNRITIFGSYKQGYLSGGFNAPSIRLPNSDALFDQQNIAGFEGGLKMIALNGNLRADLTAYDYNIKGLQVSSVVITPTGPVLETTNAGKVSLSGVELAMTYGTPIPGLTFNGAAAYSRGVTDRFTFSCYGGQTQAEGCNFGPQNAAGRFSQQDRSGKRLVRSPKWTFNVGLTYKATFNGGETLTLSPNLSYVSEFDTDSAGSPGGIQKGYALLDATALFVDRSKLWEFAVIGQNLSNRYYIARSTAVVGTGTSAGGLTGTRADTQAGVSRGREVKFRVTRRF
ncbi:TonB-dependent receptor [Sphingopyxis sp. MG]|uniref:TonB-dependent receptor n=1 Tax=Sphingopyxis sp. MG TaxID=1866325 RepID=UPI000CDF4E5A|nr:TonB-dependent receptor [Sphingopyxis sp. MG]AVA14673.1 hypothetical protein C3E99_13130 [Sphingopyxis sp. MG]